MKLFKSLKFKLTLWYSLVLLILSIVFVLTVNGIISYYYHRDPLDEMYAPLMINRPVPPRLRELTEESRELIYESRIQDLQAIREISILSFGPLIALSFGGGYLIADQMLRPLKKLNSTMTTITSEQLNEKIEFEDTGDEISEVIRNFNSMISRLNTSFESQKQFIENASHELKTPLTVIQTNLETALSQNNLSQKDFRELLQTATDSSKFMNELLEDLLLLAMLSQKIKMKKIVLNDVVERSIQQLSPLAKEYSITIESKIPKNKLRIKGNEVLLQRAIMNIIENAIKYSPAKSSISIVAKRKKNLAKVSVVDVGPGIPRSKKSKIFERFYRIDKSRSRKTGGTGLGLSIAKEIVEGHRGNIVLRSGKTGSTFTISLPLLPSRKQKTKKKRRLPRLRRHSSKRKGSTA